MSPRVALVHDWLTGMRGGEKCLEAMCELYPDATLFTLLHRRGHLSPAIERMEIRTSWIQRLPLWRRTYRHLLPALPSAWPSGKVRGLRGRGGYTVDITWDGGKMRSAVVRADRDGRVRVRIGATVRDYEVKAGTPLELPAR